MPEQVEFHFREIEYHNLINSPTGPIGRDLWRRGGLVRVEAKALAPARTGALKKSITNSLAYNDFSRPPLGGSTLTVRVGSVLHYALFVHSGTRAHWIFAKPGRVLKFHKGGVTVFTSKVHHPRTRGKKFLSIALRAAVRR